MLRNRLLLIVLGGSLVTGSAAWADEVGYIDCTSHPEDTKVLAKAAKTQEVAAVLPCGERFTILQGAFFFSRIQTKDGKIGYVFTNQISRDYAAASAPQLTPAKMAARSSNPLATIAGVLRPKPTQGLRLPAPPARTETPASTSKVSETPATVAQTTPTTISPQAAPAPAQAAASIFPAKTAIVVQASTPGHAEPKPAQHATAPANFPAKTAVVVQPEPATPAPGQPQPAAAPVPASASNLPDTSAVVVQPEASTAAQPEPTPERTPAEPTAAAFRPASLEKTIPSSRREPLIELFGGYGFARLDGGAGVASNLHGAMGSIGWNVAPWLQIVADSSYNVVTITGTKNVLYGNHYGPRAFLRGRNRWGITPFVEGLVGGSRTDTTVSGTGGYTTSVNCISFKAGGGLDIRTSRHLTIRLLNVDYYRTSFGTNVHQNNYWASAGIIVRFLGGGSE